MSYCQSYLPTHCFSCFGLDPEAPSDDYEIRLVRAQDPAYIPPDSEAWPIYYRAAIEAAQKIPGAFEAVVEAVRVACESLRGRRALPPHLLIPGYVLSPRV